MLSPIKLLKASVMLAVAEEEEAEDNQVANEEEDGNLTSLHDVIGQCSSQ